ncbi:MAG: flagellar basal body-associated FliL family protein [Desulfosporosinus sp.]|nr:flagellar basal body-associated FliL family protein [Desulfosporosinus sp.]
MKLKINLKTRLPMILALLVGVALGVGGIMGVQKFILPASTPSTQAGNASQTKQVGPLVDLGEFTVNLQGGSFLKTSLTVEGTDAKADTLLKSKVAFMKDKVNSVLSNKSLVDVQTPAAREKLRQELINNLNEVADNKITDVLFISMVYQ